MSQGERDVVVVSGRDAVAFLQGQLSQDIEALAVGESRPSFLLSPQGRVDAWLEARRRADDAVDLVVSPGWGDAVEARLRRFLLRTRAEIQRSTEPADAADDAARIAAGVPAMGAEIDERTIPAETGWVDASVSFTKGCFVGQELVARMDSRSAEPPRRLVRVRVDAPRDAVLAKGDAIDVADAAAGELTSAAWSADDGAHVALGYVRRGTDLTAPTQVAGHPATILGLVGGADRADG